jgi:7-cyano-7-deazaguanine synthase in queuosine biosynthesis
MSKIITVLFSGGLDSTYLIYDNLLLGNVVQPIHIKIKNNENKSLTEEQAINNLMEILPEYGKIKTLIKHEILVGNGGGEIDFKQMPSWMMGLLYSVTQKTDEIHIGYVCGDEIVSYLKDIKKIYKSYQPFFDFKLPKLKFPLVKKHKSVIYSKLPKNIIENLVYCETPLKTKNGFKKCNKCYPCNKYKYLIDIDETIIGKSIYKIKK